MKDESEDKRKEGERREDVGEKEVREGRMKKSKDWVLEVQGGNEKKFLIQQNRKKRARGLPLSTS